MKHIVILISGRGTNMTAIAAACAAEGWDAAIVAVIANRPGAAGLAHARALGIATRVVDHQAFANRAEFDLALAAEIDAFSADVVVLAGFMRILTDGFVARYAGRLVNVHPSLLPAFTGLHTHRRALEAGCKLAGATIHFVTPALDHGPIIVQAVVPIEPGDTPETLAARVLQAEHIVYPRAVRWLVEDRLHLEADETVRHVLGEPQHVAVGFRTDSPRC